MFFWVVESDLQQPIDEGRLLIITSFDVRAKSVTEKIAIVRNQLMIELANEVVVSFSNADVV